jgi:F0F1-type ATP synthase assembly protein I
MSNTAPEPAKGRIRQMRQAYTITKRSDRNIGLILLLTFLVVGGVFAALGYFLFGSGTLGLIITVLFGLLTGLLGVLIVFGRRAEKAAYAQVEGQKGAAAGALQMLRRGWETKPAVAFNKNQDVVHRVVGRPGIILVGEGNPNAVRALLSSEVKKHARIGGEDVPVTTIIVGKGEGEVPLTKLVKHIQKLPKKIKPAQMTSVLYKIKAIDAMRPAAPMPRGPVPTSMKGSRKAMRG